MHSLHDATNDNDERLIIDINMAAAQELMVLSTRYSYTAISIWEPGNPPTVNQINHVLIDRRQSPNVLDVKSYRGANLEPMFQWPSMSILQSHESEILVTAADDGVDVLPPALEEIKKKPLEG